MEDHAAKCGAGVFRPALVGSCLAYKYVVVATTCLIFASRSSAWDASQFFASVLGPDESDVVGSLARTSFNSTVMG
jgi:hypothetical protein